MEADRLAGLPDRPRSRSAQRAGETYDRGVTASGTLRQMLAILTQPNRSPRLRALKMPALVVHGLADKMVHVSGGRATAAAIPGAELLLIDGMGHDLPPALFETFADGIARATVRYRAVKRRAVVDATVTGQREPTRRQRASVGEALAGVGVEDVHVVRVGGHVDRVALLHGVAAGDPDDDVARACPRRRRCRRRSRRRRAPRPRSP